MSRSIYRNTQTTIAEINNEHSNMKNGKARGPDGILYMGKSLLRHGFIYKKYRIRKSSREQLNV